MSTKSATRRHASTAPAITAALPAWSWLLVAVVFYLRSHYLAPMTGTGLINSTSGNGQVPWLLSQR